MNIFELANIRPQRPNTYQVRQERIKRAGSPYYPWTPGIIATTASVSIYVPDYFPESKKYSPLDWLEIVNNEAANNLAITLNGPGGDVVQVPAGVIRTVSNASLWHVTITNNGAGNTTAGLVVLTFRKAPMTIDQWARREK